MEETLNQPRLAEMESFSDLPCARDATRIEQLCEAVRGLSPEFKLAWQELKSGTPSQHN